MANTVVVKEGNGPKINCPVGGTVISGNIQWLKVPEYHQAIIHRGASLGVRDKTSIFYAGEYHDAWLYGRWLQQKGPKFVVVSTTGFQERELLKCGWREKARDGKFRSGFQKFEPGDFDARDGDFRNDVFETVWLPADSTAILWEDSGQSRRFVKFGSHGRHNLEANELSHRISSLTYKLDDWKEISQRLGDVISRREVGQPITIPFKSTGLPGAVLHPYVALGRTREAETNWHVDQRVGFSATIGTGESSPVKAEFTVSTETEAGGGGSKVDGYTEGAGVTVDAAADDEGILSGFILAQLLSGEQEVFRMLRNLRTHDTTEQKGVIEGQFYRFEVNFEQGKGI